MLWFAAGLIGHAIVEILARAFYSLHDTKTPVVVGIVAMSLNVAFSYLFSAIFLRINWMPHGGLALANSVATALEAVALTLLMRKRLGGLQGQHILAGAAKGLLAALVMRAGLWWWLGNTQGIAVWLVGVGGVAIGGIIFLFAGLFLGVQEIRSGLGYLLRRFGLAG